MIRQTSFFFVLATFFLVYSGCKSSTAPENNGAGGATGTILFNSPGYGVSTSQLGTGTSSVLFQGNDPAYAPGGRIIYYVYGSNTADNKQRIYTANPNGTNTQSIVDFGQSNTDAYVHQKMSPDGQYVSFNYYESVSATLGPTYGTLIYKSDGTPYLVAQNVWDADWAPDGSMIASGTMTDFDGQYSWGPPGLFKYDKSFANAPVSIGTGLTTPRYPAVSPDGKKVAFTMNSHLWVINMDGTGLKQITDGANEQTFPCWSPDGNSIACQSTGDGGVISDEGMAIVPANPATASTISSSTNFWVADKSSPVGVLDGQGNIGWK